MRFDQSDTLLLYPLSAKMQQCRRVALGPTLKINSAHCTCRCSREERGAPKGLLAQSLRCARVHHGAISQWRTVECAPPNYASLRT